MRRRKVKGGEIVSLSSCGRDLNAVSLTPLQARKTQEIVVS